MLVRAGSPVRRGSSTIPRRGGFIRYRLTICTAAVVLAAVWIPACSSSEETGASRGKDRSEQVGPIVSEPRTAQGTSQQGLQSAGGTATDGMMGDPTLRRGRDTVLASTQRIARTNVQRQPLRKPPDAMYTVQVGAFKSAPNALSMQKSLKGQLGSQPVFNMFAPADGLYRVTVGKFETLREASRYRNELLKEHPNRFGECWVTYIERSQ